MPLSQEQRAALEAEAAKQGVDPAALIREAEAMIDGGDGPGTAGAAPTSKEKPNLFMYLLPFVTVNEVRTIWLELGEVPGGEEYAEAFAAKQRGGGGQTPPAAE